jgi:succinate dehydrogenase / fumarate reductase cytochrome b subunit
MIQEYQLRILPEIAANEQKLKEYLSKEKGLNLLTVCNTCTLMLREAKNELDANEKEKNEILKGFVDCIVFNRSTSSVDIFLYI